MHKENVFSLGYLLQCFLLIVAVNARQYWRTHEPVKNYLRASINPCLLLTLMSFNVLLMSLNMKGKLVSLPLQSYRLGIVCMTVSFRGDISGLKTSNLFLSVFHRGIWKFCISKADRNSQIRTNFLKILQLRLVRNYVER